MNILYIIILSLFAFSSAQRTNVWAEDVRVVGDTKAESLSLKNDVLPNSGADGEIRYNSDDKQLYIRVGAEWRPLRGNKNVATRIVAAYNSRDSRDPSGPTTVSCDGAGGPCFNPRADNGYTCDGQNDEATIQEAIDSLGNKKGGVVYLLEGTYNISGSIRFDNGIVGAADGIDDSNNALIGAGRGTVLKMQDTGSGYAAISINGANNILIRQLKIDGDNASNSRGISLANASWCQLARLVVKGVEKRAIILKASSQNNIISSGYFVDNKDIAIRVNSNCPNNSIQDNIFITRISTNVPMIKIRSDNNIIVDNNIQDNDPQDGTFRFQDGISLSAASNNIISGNYILQAKRAGVYLENSSDNNQITANQIQDGKKQGIILKNSDMNIVGANNISGNEKNGIVIRGGSDSNLINQNIVYDNGDNNNYSGIKVIRDSDNNFISANRIYDSRGSGYGININNANCNDSYLVANYIDGPGYIDTNASTPYDRRIQDKGQGTQYTGKEKLTLERNPSVLILNGGVNGGDNIDPGTSPRTYIALKSFSNNIDAGIVNGKAAGDILILQGTDDTHTVTIKDSSSNVNLTANRILGAGDTLTLIWNGNKWLEVGFSDN